MPTDALAQSARTLVEAWNRADDDVLRRLTGPGYVYEEAASGRRVLGVDAVLAEWTRLRSTFPDAQAELCSVEVRGQTTLACLRWRATGVRGAAEDRHLELWDLVSVHWRDGLAVTEQHRIGLLSLTCAVTRGRAALRLGRGPSPTS